MFRHSPIRHLQTIRARKVREAFGDMLRHDGRNVAKAARAIEQATSRGCHQDALEAIDVALGGHGVEALRITESDDYHTDCGIAFCPAFTYVNMGDTYALTVLRDHERGSWIVACYGDVVEWYERNHPTKGDQ